MVKSDFERLKDLIIKVMTLHQTAVSNHGHQEVFGVLKKNETYGFNEMNAAMLLDRLDFLSDPSAKPPKQTAKLSVMDFIIGMAITQDFSPFIAIASFFNMACFNIPEPNIDETCLISILQEINKEHFENNNEVMERLKDGRFCSKDAKAIIKESDDLINATAKLRHLAMTKIKG